jgi:beta-lactamase class D
MCKFISVIVLILAFSSCGLPKFQIEKAVSLDLKKEESKFYSFSVVIYDLNTKQYFFYNDSLAQVPFSPASTFKIPNSLIGLETGILKDSTTKLLKDSMSNLTLKYAFQHSIVPYYQELARKIGDKDMSAYLKRFHYGNEQASPELTTFWLKGDLRISALQQIEFLYKIEKQKLGLRPETHQTLMEIFELRRNHPFDIYGKTGWGYQEGKDIGWFVGFAEWGKSRYLFATVMTSPEDAYGKFDFGSKRIILTEAAFQQLFKVTNF